MAVKTYTLSFGVPRRRFIAVQAAKAGLGLALALGFCFLVGPPGLEEKLAMAGLMAPGLLAFLAFTPIPLGRLEQAGLILFASLIGYLAALTGGAASPLIIWFALVPAEAALAGERAQLVRAGFAAAVAFLIVVSIQAADLLPVSRITLPLWQVYAVSVLAALLQAVLVAAAAQDRRRAADQAAAEGTAMYRFLADNAMDLITRHASDGRIRFASPASQALLGRTPAELEGQTPSSLVHADDLAAIQAAFMDAAYLDRAATAEVRLKSKDKGYVWAEIRCRPAAAGEMGEPADIVAVTRDISERKRQERALIEARDAAESASRAKSAFLANMSHELRTPLNAIIGFSEVMTQEIFGGLAPRYREYSRHIHESGGHLLELINSVLDMSKIEAGKFELHEELFDLEEVASSAIRFCTPAAERGGVALKLAITPAAQKLFADKRAVKQMLINLLSNGVKFTPRGGDVRVAARASGTGLEIAVADSGTGIASRDLEKLGRPFEQVEGAQTRTREGTGLGLALVKALVAMHGGEMKLSSVLGEGTIVTLRLPYAAVDQQGGRMTSAQILPFRAAS